MEQLWQTIAGLGYGIGSALVPVLNAEAYILLVVARFPWAVVPVVLTVSLGQTIGKVILFEAARRGADRWTARERVNEKARAKWWSRVQTHLANKRTGYPLVFVSSALGIPPLALVCLAAGAAGQSLRAFVVLCLTGRILRFGLVAIPAVYGVDLFR